MNRALTSKLIVLCLTLVGVLFESRTYAWASPAMRASQLSPDERAEWARYANDTGCSFEYGSRNPVGLPADSLPRDGVGWGNPTMSTTPARHCRLLWSVLAAERLKLIGTEEFRSRVDRRRWQRWRAWKRATAFT